MKIEKIIRQKIESAFNPDYYELENESSKHSVPPGSETHFRLLLVSEKFSGISRVDRQRQVNQILADEMSGGVHALSQRALTPDEWEKMRDQFPMVSPECQGGKKNR
ncbi:MAG: BolA family protein [Bdellovibrionota bacterium]